MELIQETIQVTKPFLPPFQEYVQEIERIWSSAQLSNNGPIHREFEEKLSNFLDTKHVSLLVNGHMALETAIKSLGLQGEVITTPFTFASTVHAIANSGLTPVFCDVNLEDFTIDTTRIESLITEKTSAILPVHVFGYPCNISEIGRIADQYGLKVIYDAAHAFGVKAGDTGIGNFGDISMFSLHATKVFHSIEGGILTYGNGSRKQTIELYKNFGISGPETVEIVGTNAKMNEFQAAMGVVNLRHVESAIEQRKQVALRYRERLREVEGLRFQQDVPGIKHNYAYFPICVDEAKFGSSRDELHERLKTYNILTRKYFYPLCSDFACYKQTPASGRLENAELIAGRILCLPIYSSLPLDSVDYICDAIRKISESPVQHAYGANR